MKKNELGNRYSRLLVIGEAPSNHRGDAQWLCKCDCGKELIVSGASLRNGNTKSCGCLKIDQAKKHLEDLTGKRFGHLTVIRRGPNEESNRMSRWYCKCDCGKETLVRSASLKSGVTTTCGCRSWMPDGSINELGNVYGHLTVMARADNTANGTAQWLCKCKCGNEIVVRGTDLRNKGYISCGCVKSKGEYHINTFLSQKGIDFKTQYSFGCECKNPKTDRVLYYDVALFKNGELVALIEYDGPHHFTEEDMWYGKDVSEIKYRDEIKNEFAKNKNVPLERISYLEDLGERLQQIMEAYYD